MSDATAHEADRPGPPITYQEVRLALLLALVMAPRELLPEPLRGVEPADEAVPDLDIVLHERAAERLVRRVAVEAAAPTATPERTVAVALVYASTAPLVAVQHPAGPEAARRLQRALGLGTAFVVGKIVASHFGMVLRLDDQARRLLMIGLRTRNITAVAGAVAECLAPGGSLPRRRSRALVVAPLTHVSRSDHSRLMREARTARVELESLGYEVDGPDPGLHPDSSFDNDPLERHEQERASVLAANLVVVVGAQHESWGASRVVTWAECNGTPVLVLVRGSQALTRVLSASPHRTTQLSYDGISELEQRVRRWAARQLDAAAAHAEAGDVLRGRVAARLPALAGRAEATDAGRPARLLPRLRERSIVATPDALLQATMRELACLPLAWRSVLVGMLTDLLLWDAEGPDAAPAPAAAVAVGVPDGAEDDIDIAYRGYRRGELSPERFVALLRAVAPTGAADESPG